MPLAPGTRVDRYEVVDLLGAGGMGEVYRALDPRLERHVALKILRAHGERVGTEGSARLLREARAVAAFSHPNIVAVYDVGEILEPGPFQGTAYIAMELVVGASLRSYVGDASVPIARRIDWMKDVAGALAAAHEVGLVHRDVKPENVMIRVDGFVKVLDFGIARRVGGETPALTTAERHDLPTMRTNEGVVSALTAPGSAPGTPFYMAPEQLRGASVDGRADQFAWAVVAYELLVGSPPWSRAGSAFVIAAEILSLEPVLANEAERRVPAAVAASVRRAMAKDPASRFASMNALLASLDGADRAEGESPRARLPSEPRPRPLATGRRSAIVRAGWLGAFGVAALAAIGLSRARPQVRTAIDSSVSSSTLGAAGDPCTSSAACSREHGGAAWRCSEAKHTCVELASPDCKVLAEPGDLARDDTVWFGGMFPVSVPGWEAEVSATDLARQDFARAIGSASALADGSHPRPIALVVCDESADPVRAARHLADDVEVPAVLGFRKSALALKTLATVFLPARVLSFVTIGQAAAMTKIPGPPGAPRLVWRTTLRSATMAEPLAALTAVLEKERRGGRTIPFRVAVLRDATLPDDYATALFEALRFNGKSALENGDDYRVYVVDEHADAGAEAAVSALLDFAPDVVVPQVNDFETRILAPLESQWRRKQRPYYLDSSDFSAETIAFAGRDADRRRRFFGVTNASTTMTNAELVLHYNAVHPDAPVTRTTAPQPSYDAFYTLAYALYALGDARVDGPALSRAIDRLLPPARKVDVGPAGIIDAFETLRSGGSIDLSGAIGSLDFDRATGEAPIDYAILCLGVDDRGAAATAVESGLVYSPATGKLTGTNHCR